MSKIYFIEPHSNTKISYNKVHSVNEFRWKDINFNLKLCYDWPRENFSTPEEEELYNDYIDLLDVYVFYKLMASNEQ